MYHIIGYQTNPITGETIFNILCDTVADLPSSPVSDNGYGGEIGQGSKAVIIADGSSYLADSNRQWIYQPNPNAWVNVYTKSEIDEMITEIYETIAYYHTTLISDTGEITFYAVAGHIGTWTIFGNGQQTETPTPDAPIMLTFCGVRTGNIVDIESWLKKYNIPYTKTGSTFEFSASSYLFSNPLWFSDEDITISLSGIVKALTGSNIRISTMHADGTAGRNIALGGTSDVRKAENLQAAGIRLDYTYPGNLQLSDIMLNLGSTALPYEPYGYKIPISCGGQTNNVYLSAPLRKAIDGTDAVDTLESTGIITRNVDENGNALATPTTETVNVPDIPIVKGENTLTVDTILKPSRIEIQG